VCMGTQFSLAEAEEREDLGGQLSEPPFPLLQNGTWDRSYLAFSSSGGGVIRGFGVLGFSCRLGGRGILAFDSLHNEQPTKNCFGQNHC
jgi:hypothetical protein